jgi:hypothetical protein
MLRQGIDRHMSLGCCWMTKRAATRPSKKASGRPLSCLLFLFSLFLAASGPFGSVGPAQRTRHACAAARPTMLRRRPPCVRGSGGHAASEAVVGVSFGQVVDRGTDVLKASCPSIHSLSLSRSLSHTFSLFLSKGKGRRPRGRPGQAPVCLRHGGTWRSGGQGLVPPRGVTVLYATSSRRKTGSRPSQQNGRTYERALLILQVKFCKARYS